MKLIVALEVFDPVHDVEQYTAYIHEDVEWGFLIRKENIPYKT